MQNPAKNTFDLLMEQVIVRLQFFDDVADYTETAISCVSSVQMIYLHALTDHFLPSSAIASKNEGADG